MRRLARLLALAPAAVSLIATGCSTGGPPAQRVLPIDESGVTEFQLRILTTDYARRFAGAVEAASTEIAVETDDPAVRRAALLWRNNAITACQSAMLKPDPIVALMDMWALTEQMARFLDSGLGQGLFGEWQPIAVDAGLELEQNVTELAVSVAEEENLATMQQWVESWVEEHPIHDLEFTRQYPRELVERVRGGQRLGAFAAVESLEERLEIYSQFLPIFVEFLPKQIRWQSAVMIDDYVTREEIQKAGRDLDTIGIALVGVHQELDELPLLLNAQRDAAVVAARTELDRLVAEVDALRIATIEAIDTQRVETIDVLREERQIVLSAVEDLREETMRELPGAIAESVREVSPDLRNFADYLFWRAAILFGGLSALVLLATLVIVLTKRRPAVSTER